MDAGSICSVKRNVHVIVPASRFRLTQGEDKLTLYQVPISLQDLLSAVLIRR